MRINNIWIASLLFLVAWGVSAKNPDSRRPAVIGGNAVKYRSECANSEWQIDQAINNVRARLLGGGDCWWNFDVGRYIVPKVDPSTGQQEVSSIFAGSVWLGGVDPAGNLKLACQDYRSDGKNDFWPGPLNEKTGTTDADTCGFWDRPFRVTGTEIRAHLSNLARGITDPDAIPKNVKGWPARGNPYFLEVWGFPAPYTNQGLAGFFDVDGDGDYEPLDGDYPSIDIRGCALDRYPDEMIFWIYNDHGGGAPHARTGGKAIQMEVQVQAFGYVTNDELNDMTFQRYKLINRATELIDSTFFAMWIDPDLGCHADDYIGCDSAKSLMFVYNQDDQDGQSGCDCGGTPTYCNHIPILGVDYFRGPLDEFGNEIGMSSFMYYNNGGIGNPPAGTADPSAPAEYYNYITGSWRDGSPLVFGGSGYQSGGAPVKYAFTESPSDPNGWSMCTANLTYGDRRTLQASGPFRLLPTAINELIIGVPWVPDAGACPDLEGLFRADKLAQGLFDNCFKLQEGPDAPKVDWIELHQQVVAVLSYPEEYKTITNNYNEQYKEQDILAPDYYVNNPDPAVRDSANYRFEGYKIYQLIDPNVSAADFDDPDKSRLVYQVDIRNGVSKLYNWDEQKNPLNGSETIYTPVLKVEGGDDGIRHTFSVKEDKFAPGNDKRLINHKKYYYSVIAYGYNNFGDFEPKAPFAVGQQRPYIVGRKGYDGLEIKRYTVIPRPIIDQVLQSSYGDGIEISRLEGVGTGNNFLDMTDATRDAIASGNFADSVITYQAGKGPFNVTIFNPFEVQDGEYELVLVDNDNTDTKLQDTARWELRKLPDGQVIASDRTIAEINEQLVSEYGFSISISQVGETGEFAWKWGQGRLLEPGRAVDENNGGIGAEIVYEDPDNPWILGIPDEEEGVFHYVKTRPNEKDRIFDPERKLSQLGDGFFVPYVLCDYQLGALPPSQPRMITPGWTDRYIPQIGALNTKAIGDDLDPFNPANATKSRYSRLFNLPNVDIVLTDNKDLWSRCVVVESTSAYYTDASFPKAPGLDTESPTTADLPNPKKRVMFDVRWAPSVGKNDSNNDGLPDPDGSTDANGKLIRGMGWFPGYAIDVETGRRLNIFFGENSCYSSGIEPQMTGRDMMWNPTDEFFNGRISNLGDYYNLVMGGQHWVYVMNTPYDECETVRKFFTPELNNSPGTAKIEQVGNIAWAGMLMLQPDASMKPYKDGLIPNNAVIKLRVANPYQTWFNDEDNNKRNGNPRYRFKIEGREAQPLQGDYVGNALDSIKCVPNPYYGFSDYEVSQFSNIIKITNLPAVCSVTIYSLDGKFIRQYQRNESYAPYSQITPALEWDLKNSKGIPVASGVYLVHVSAPGLGERTVKWFGIARQFDPSGL